MRSVSGAQRIGRGRLPGSHCERLTLSLASGQPRRIGISIRRHRHSHARPDRSVDRATRPVGDVEEHPLGVRTGDYALHRGGPVRDADS